MAKTRAERKARNRQRAGDRARHVDALYDALYADAAVDALLTACDGCGLEQVSPKPRLWVDEFDPLAYGCVVCGSLTGRYVAGLESGAWNMTR